VHGVKFAFARNSRRMQINLSSFAGEEKVFLQPLVRVLERIPVRE
jgi:hypothetical protein